MFMRLVAACIVALATLSAARKACADVTFGAEPFNTPYLVGTGAFGLYPFVAGDSSRSLIAVGTTLPGFSSTQTSLVVLGSAAGGALQGSTPILSDYVPGGIATSAYPEPMLVVLGTRTQDSEIHYGFQVFAGSPLHAVYRRELPYSFNWPVAAALTRVASLSDFDIAFGADYGIALQRSYDSAPIWQFAETAHALATLPATGTLPVRLVSANDTGVDIRSVDDGHVLWTSTATGGKKIAVGNITGGADLEFVVLGSNGMLSAFQSDPPTLLWQNTDANAASFSLGDRNGDGTLEIAVVTFDGQVKWLGGNGAPVGGTATLPYPATEIAVAKVDAAAGRVVTIADEYTGAELQVRSLDLATRVADMGAAAGPFDHIAIGDIDGDGDGEMVALSTIPWGYAATGPANSSLLSIRDVATHALVWQSAIPAGLGPTSSDQMLDVAIGRVQPGTGQQIVVLGIDIGGGFQPIIDIVDGTTHAVLRRTLIDVGEGRVPTHLRLVDVDGDGIAEIVLASQPSTSTATGVRVHVLNGSTLANEWTSPVLTSQFPASWVGTRPTGGAGPEHLILTVAQGGFWSIDLASHLVDYSVPADASAAGHVPDASPAGRIAIIDATASALIIVDAASGAEIARLPLPNTTYRAVAALPGEFDRVALATDDHLESWNLASHMQEGASPILANDLARNGTLLARASGAGAVLYAGDAVGLWSLPAIEFQQLIFASGFEP